MKVFDIHIHLSRKEPDMDGYVRAMDRFGVEAALVHGTPGGGSERGLAAIARVLRQHKGRLYGSAHVDLRRPARENLRTAREAAGRGFKCIKLFPNLGFDPNDERHEPFWQGVEDLGLAVLSHCGYAASKADPKAPSSMLTASPFHFEVPARRHPKTHFVFAHFGGGATYLETVVLISRLPNCFADTCPGWGKWVWEQRMPGLDGLDRSKILYGTDSAGERYGDSIKFWTRTMKGYGYRKADLQSYFYDNARRVLKLDT